MEKYFIKLFPRLFSNNPNSSKFYNFSYALVIFMALAYFLIGWAIHP